MQGRHFGFPSTSSAAVPDSNLDGNPDGLAVSWTFLPSELLLVILEWLSLLSPRTMLLAAPAVSTRWRDLCREQLTVDLDLRWVDCPASETAIEALMARFKHARTLDLSDAAVTDRGMSLAAVSWPALTAICLDCCTGVTDVAVGMVAAHCTRLVSLNLAYCTKITDKVSLLHKNYQPNIIY